MTQPYPGAIHCPVCTAPLVAYGIAISGRIGRYKAELACPKCTDTTVAVHSLVELHVVEFNLTESSELTKFREAAAEARGAWFKFRQAKK